MFRIGLILAIFVSGIGVSESGLALSPEYEQLKKQLKNDTDLDTQLKHSLPEPETAHEYHLRSKTRGTIKRALSDLDTALKLASTPGDALLVDWLNLGLLVEPSSRRLNQLRSILKSSAPADRSGEVWLLAGKYAVFLERYSLAVEWAKKAVSHDNIRYQALLDLAEYQVLQEKYSSARRNLNRYLLGRQGSTAARAWTIRGRLLRRTESDSEAYLAYSHIIRNYPNTLELAEAERAIDELPLPAPFKPTGNGQTTFTTPDQSNYSSESSTRDTVQGDWVVQLGSFLSAERARDFKRRLKQDLDWSITISAATVDGSRYHRVQITGLASKEKATEVKRELKQRGHDAFILKG